MSAQVPAKGHTRKHSGGSKHGRRGAKHNPVHHHKSTAAHQGHHVHAAAKGAKPATPRGLAVGDWLPLCSLEAVAQSLRLAGQPVHDDEVAWLWELAGGRELSVPEALQAAARFGLAGCRPALWPVHGEVPLDPGQADALPVGIGPGIAPLHHLGYLKAPQGEVWPGEIAGLVHAASFHALILGIDVPGPHCVLATPAGWWSWGRLWDPWPCAIEEAWEVSWRA